MAGKPPAKKGFFVPLPIPNAPSNNCLRLALLYLFSLGVVVVTAIILGTGALASLLGGLGRGGGTTTASTNSTGAPVAVSIPALSQGGGPVAPGPGGAAINSQQSASPQGGTVIGWGSPAFYIVQPGDTLDSIAARFGTTAATLKAYNPGLTNSVFVSQVIFLPPVNGDWLPGTGRNASP